MLWSRRDALVASVGEPSWTGPAAIFVAAIMLIVGELCFAFFLLLQAGLVLVLLGVVLSLGGNSLLGLHLSLSLFSSLPSRFPISSMPDFPFAFN